MTTTTRGLVKSPAGFVPPSEKVSIRLKLLRDGEVTDGYKFARVYRGMTSLGDPAMVFWTEPGAGPLTQEFKIDPAERGDNGRWLLVGFDDATPATIVSSYVDLDQSGTYTVNVQARFDIHTLEGNGYLAGSFPGGITTVDGVPTAATVRVLYRPAAGQPGDGALVAEVQSAPDGSWRVDGLDPALKFDVVGRKAWFNDVIMSNVSPKVD